jgi:2-polyprenyl-6-methoxyphenol hydroxylase-like FAD-dependent oxidoreductase
MADTKTIETPILIVGGGPVGLALATDLGWRGTPCLLIEQGEGPVDHPRATAINARSMEFMRRWGVGEAVCDAAYPEDFPHTALYCTTLTGFEVARIDRHHHGGRGPSETSPERAQRCNQLFLDPILQARAAGFSTVDMRYRHRLESVAEEGDHVIATVRNLASDEVITIAAQHVIDCSGGHSTIRRQLGATMSGSPYAGYFVSIYLRAPELWAHHNMGKAALINFVDPDGLWRNLVMLDGRALYRFGVRGKAFYDDPDKIDGSRLFTEAVGADVPHELISTRRWVARNVVSDTYRHGRILFAGDAAHLNHPSSGLGLNTGLGDAVDLGWKLSAINAGWGGSALLDSYEPERQPVGRRNIGHAGNSHASDREQEPTPVLFENTADGERARRTMGDAIVASQTKKFVTDGLALGYRYDPSPINWQEVGPGPELEVTDYHPTAFTGGRAPHAWLGANRSTLDVFGRGFTLLRFSADAPEPSAIERGFADKGVPLAVETVEDPSIGALYERKLVLVRPDGHVAWRSDTTHADPAALADRVRGQAIA